MYIYTNVCMCVVCAQRNGNILLLYNVLIKIIDMLSLRKDINQLIY